MFFVPVFKVKVTIFLCKSWKKWEKATNTLAAEEISLLLPSLLNFISDDHHFENHFQEAKAIFDEPHLLRTLSAYEVAKQKDTQKKDKFNFKKSWT